ncbi:hypothetical protein Hanom_Chr07g00625721 [Helianthus anomalus]
MIHRHQILAASSSPFVIHNVLRCPFEISICLETMQYDYCFGFDDVYSYCISHQLRLASFWKDANYEEYCLWYY